MKVGYVGEWFDGCINLTTLIDFKNLDVSDYADFSYMFRNCESLQDLKGLQNCRNMFSFCKSLQDLKGLQNWNVSNDEDFSDMFKNCSKVKEIE